jgi:hypothetical protein
MEARMSPGQLVHPLIQEARGMCSDECPHVEIDGLLGQALDAAKDLEADVKRLRDAIEEYALWEPGRAGHAEAHRKLLAAARGEA